MDKWINQVHQGNALDLLRQLPSDFVKKLCIFLLTLPLAFASIESAFERRMMKENTAGYSEQLLLPFQEASVSQTLNSPLVFCACGCGHKRPFIDRHGQKRYYLNGHCKKGRFIKGRRYSPETEFKKGQHWRKRKPLYNKDWLIKEYVIKRRTCSDIARDFGIGMTAVQFWLNKHGIKGRTISETRKIKYWGVKGEKNPMFGKKGILSPNWKGGLTPERQEFYSTIEWRRVSRFVRKRDKHKCQRCGEESGGVNNYSRRLHIHHIISFRVREFRCEPMNLVLLCYSCHRWVHSKENREKRFLNEKF